MEKYQAITWEHLTHQLRTAEYLELLDRLGEAEPSLQFRSWTEVIEAVDEDNAALRTILDANSEVQDNRWQTVLLAMFWLTAYVGMGPLHAAVNDANDDA